MGGCQGALGLPTATALSRRGPFAVSLKNVFVLVPFFSTFGAILASKMIPKSTQNQKQIGFDSRLRKGL